MANAGALGAFVQATILDPATGALSVYEPLVITQGTTPAVAPVVPTLPAGAIVTIDIGFNGTDLTQVGATANALQQGNCVDGLNGSVFGQVSFCNGTQFFQAAARAEQAGQAEGPGRRDVRPDRPAVPDDPWLRRHRPGPQRQRDQHLPAHRERADGPAERS